MRKTIILVFLLILSAIASLIWLQDEYGCPEENRDSCLLGIVYEKRGLAEKNICDEIKDREKKDICFFSISQYYPEEIREICDKITLINGTSYYTRDNCYFKAALDHKNKQFCESIQGEFQRQLCFDAYN